MTPTLNAMINVDQTALVNTDRPVAMDFNESLPSDVNPPSHLDAFSTNFDPHPETVGDPSPTPLLGLGLVGGYMPNGEASLSPSVCTRQIQISWLQDNSISTSTTDTVVAITPLESRAPSVKSSNLTQERNNVTLRPHQGRNPTVERNTHKCSDEELRVSGNTLISSARRDSLSTQSAPADQPVTESPPEYVSDSMDTSLVQNDALSHRNPPIPYLQNQVHGEPPAGRPKVANTSSLHGLGKGERSLREKLTRLIRPKELGLRLSSLNFFGSNKRHVYFRADDMEVDDLQQGHTTSNGDETQQPSTAASGLSHASTHPIHTEVCMHNGTAVIRPTNLPLETRPLANSPALTGRSDKRARTQASHPPNLTADGTSRRETISSQNSNRSAVHHPENQLRLAEVGVAKLYIPEVGQHHVQHLQGHSKSTSELFHLRRHNSSESCWQETELCSVTGEQLKQRRPNSLSLKGHNYNTAFRQSPPKKSSSKPDVVSIAFEEPGGYARNDNMKLSAQEPCTLETSTSKHQLKLQYDDMSDPSEKIRRRVKTPVMPSRKQARLSLYDDRLMSSGLDSMIDAETNESSVKKSSTVCRLTNNNNNNNFTVKTCIQGGEPLLLQIGQMRKDGCHNIGEAPVLV